MTKAQLRQIEQALIDAAGLLDVIKTEWEPEGCWSEWDAGVRSRITLSLNALAAQADAPAARPQGTDLGRWRYENPNLAARTIEGLRGEPQRAPEPEQIEADAQAKAQDIYICATEENRALKERIAMLTTQSENEDYLQEVADGAWGDDPRVRGLARDRLTALALTRRDEFKPCPGCYTALECQSANHCFAPAFPRPDGSTP